MKQIRDGLLAPCPCGGTLHNVRTARGQKRSACNGCGDLREPVKRNGITPEEARS